MESPKSPMKINYVVFARVAKVERKTSVLRSWKVGDEVHQTTFEHGWFVHFEGSWESIYFGDHEPLLKKDDRVRITFERID